jgi:hypothetical protein
MFIGFYKTPNPFHLFNVFYNFNLRDAKNNIENFFRSWNFIFAAMWQLLFDFIFGHQVADLNSTNKEE